MKETLETTVGNRTEPWSSARDYLRGRIGRLEYWIWFALVVIVAIGLSAAHALLLSPVLQVAFITQQNRRLHDLGKSGWWALLLVVAPFVVGHLLELTMSRSQANVLSTLVGFAFILWIGAVPGDAMGNRFGPPPARDLKAIFFKA